jgi:hypothetical protein
MDQEELISKLSLIEEQAQLTLEEFPKDLTKVRQRMIIALAKSIRSQLMPDGVPVDDAAAVGQNRVDIR